MLVIRPRSPEHHPSTEVFHSPNGYDEAINFFDSKKNQISQKKKIIMSVSFSAPWPNANSPVLAKIDFGVPLPDVLEWLQIRDTFLGVGCRNPDIPKALALARNCKHPDAVWLLSVCENVSTKGEAREVFLSREDDDARALCFLWWLASQDEDNEDWQIVQYAAEMGNAFACSTLCGYFQFQHKDLAFRLAQQAANGCERDGFFWLGLFFEKGIGCEKNETASKENYFIAAELGSGTAAERLGRMLGESDPTCWIWFGRAALRNQFLSFLGSFSEQVELFFSGCGNSSVVFLIGRALKRNIDVEKKIICDCSPRFDSWIGPANQAVSFYSSQIESARLAVDTWTLVSTRLRVIKDMRIYIGKMIWEGRFEANYKIENDPAPRSPAQKRIRKNITKANK